ncbi:hypothetical protein [Sphingobacterium sp. UDSM-2020]|uniref:hypothetical protein n=1 Tax=Sphingobacterium sp. UDSM-2020 TaxID=2795738 RepID=UPI001936F92E|nr:hypothetical protein [Sphingobacterium sp. UDSM-2020]QQD15446.1 hypothetical protein JAZ75_08015 [Sphingobacterium sp. UDSM-2020]
MNNELKKTYITPKVEFTTIELEQGIAAGSNQAESTVEQSWDNGDDDNRTITW